MLKATIYDLALFENFLGVINKFVQHCQFVISTEKTDVFCKNPTSFASSRLLLNTNVIILNEGQDINKINICIRDIVAFKSAISIVSQVENVVGIEIGLETVGGGDEIFVKNIKYKSKKGGSFNLVTIDFDVIKEFISKDSSITLKDDWSFDIDPKLLDIVQNKTNNIVNLDEVSVYIKPKKPNGEVIVELASKKSTAMNSIAIPISNKSIGSLEKFAYDEIAIHESSFRIMNILKVNEAKDLHCIFNFENNVFFITSELKKDDYYIKSRLFIQMVKGK